MTLNDELLAGLGDQGLEQIAGMLGTDTLTARKVVEAVSGTIVGGMARNAEHPDGADALRGALDDHMDADPFNGDVNSLTRDGHSILGHILGGQGTEQAAAGLSQLAGVNSATIMKLLPLIAPMIMSLLANRAASRDMDAGAVADEVDRERSAIPGGLGELLGGLLSGIFGGMNVPRQGGPYEPYRTEREIVTPDAYRDLQEERETAYEEHRDARGAAYEGGARDERGTAYEGGTRDERGAAYEGGARDEREAAYEGGTRDERGASQGISPNPEW